MTPKHRPLANKVLNRVFSIKFPVSKVLRRPTRAKKRPGAPRPANIMVLLNRVFIPALLTQNMLVTAVRLVSATLELAVASVQLSCVLLMNSGTLHPRVILVTVRNLVPEQTALHLASREMHMEFGNITRLQPLLVQKAP